MEIETVIKNLPRNKTELRTRQLIHPHGYPGHLEKTREGEQNGICLRKRVKMDGNDGFRRRPEKGYVPGKDRGGSFMGQCQLAKGACVGSAHLDTIVDLC